MDGDDKEQIEGDGEAKVKEGSDEPMEDQTAKQEEK